MTFNDLPVFTAENTYRIRGDLKLTKTSRGFSDALLKYDRELEVETKKWLFDKVSADQLAARYRAFDATLMTLPFPDHYPTRFLSGTGDICSGKNIFAVFPLANGIHIASTDAIYGFEFIDAWSEIFKSIITPIVMEQFSFATVTELGVMMSSFEKTSYLASVLHEIGHRVGPFKVLPEKCPGLRLSDSAIGILSELATDSMAVVSLPEFPELAQFVIFQRLLWFGRRGFEADILAAGAGSDPDSWIGLFLWNRLRKENLLRRVQGKWQIESSKLLDFFSLLLQELNGLVLSSGTPETNSWHVEQWVARQLPANADGSVLPMDLRVLFDKVKDVPYVPSMSLPFEYSKIDTLGISSHVV